MLEKKEMPKFGWKRAVQSKYIYKYLEEYNAAISVIYLKKASAPCYKEYSDRRIKIADNGYYWLQFAIDNEKWWLTAMFNSEKKLLQCYFDITTGNIVKKDNIPYFYDLFLDVVSIKDFKDIILDEDELLDALNNNQITKEQYESANNTANKIITNLEINKNELYEFCVKQLEILLQNNT